MRITRLALFAATLALTGFACQKKADTAAEEKAIRDLDTTFNADLVARNDSALAARYADNGMLMPPNEKIVTGNAAIRAYWAQMWPMNASLVITPTTITVAASGDMATDVGTWTFSGPMTDNGKYLVHWHKIGAEWKIVNDMWSSDNPPPAAAPADSTAK